MNRNDEIRKMRNEGKSYDYIGYVFDISHERVRQIIKGMSAEEKKKVSARKKTKYAIKTGLISKKPCQECGDLNSHAHHKNYDDPYDVIWLCRKHHEDLHHPVQKK